MNSDWKFASFIEVDKPYKIDGINIWNHYWHCSDRCVEIIGFEDRQPYCFKEYRISTPEKTVNFVAGEFSDGKIGIYVKEKVPM